MERNLSAFPKIWSLGTPETQDVFDGPVEITEKIDGSQFVFGKINGELKFRSKGAIINMGAPPKLFAPAHDYICSIEHLIPDNYCFYGETLATPRHNILAYGRVPTNHIALFGAQDLTTNSFDGYQALQEWSNQFDVDTVPVLILGTFAFSMEAFNLLLQGESYLGGVPIEGVVVKNYAKAIMKGNLLFPLLSAKYVSEAFKEKHAKDWSSEKTGSGRYQMFLSQYASEARWNKAIQRLEESELLTRSPKDIGPLIKLIQTDVLDESKSEIMEALYKIFREDIARASIRGFPQWYKDKLLTTLENEDGKV